MHFLLNAVLALGMISCGLLSTALAAPTPQMLPVGGGPDGQFAIESRPCIMSRCADNDGDNDRSSMTPRQLMSHHADQADIENRQTMLSMGVDEGDVQSRQIHGGLMSEEGEIDGKLMAA